MPDFIGRFIPACAGNGFENYAKSAFLAVHPRVCGERTKGTLMVEVSRGSSPRVRGTEYSVSTARHQYRFIPACAGNGRAASNLWPTVAVHPRVCGEREETNTLCKVTLGSSPRVRGTAKRMAVSKWSRRFIPACAGNGAPLSRSHHELAVHPRVCGERTCFHPVDGTSVLRCQRTAPR